MSRTLPRQLLREGVRTVSASLLESHDSSGESTPLSALPGETFTGRLSTLRSDGSDAAVIGETLLDLQKAAYGDSSTTPPISPTSSEDVEFDDDRLPASSATRAANINGLGGEKDEIIRNERAVENMVRGKTGEAGIPVQLEKMGGKGRRGRYILHLDEDLKRLLVAHAQNLNAKEGGKRRKGKFSDLVFTKRFTTFDRSNPDIAKSHFHGFFTLFWLGVSLMIIKVFAQSYRSHGRLLSIDILSIMFERNNLFDCLLTDAIMFYGSSLWCVPLQKATQSGILRWDGSGWILQMLWQAVYIVAVIEWSLYRSWPWVQTVFIVLHCLVMLMKQHSYAFYNGHLSEVNRRRSALREKLEHLYSSFPASSTAAAAEVELSGNSELRERHHYRTDSADSGVDVTASNGAGGLVNILNNSDSANELDSFQLREFEKVLRDEIESCDMELTSRVPGAPIVQYPENLTWANYLEYIHFPTVVYELAYPRTETINWNYVLEKATATFGVLGIMIIVSQHYIYPVVMKCNDMRDLPLGDRLMEFPWVLLDLVFPFMMEYLLVWYLIWELILNLLGELTQFADRGFYGDWWNSVTWDAFARDWNKPVHNFLLRHVYHSSISAYQISRQKATLITFFLSACVHELVMWAVFKKLRGYLLCMQMLQLPLVMLSRTRLMRDQKILGNVLFWIGIWTGPSFLCSLYLII
ncbi:Sterol O-acyltransferase 2 (Sterol-ester synthase 2) [Rhizina undulata]